MLCTPLDIPRKLFCQSQYPKIQTNSKEMYVGQKDFVFLIGQLTQHFMLDVPPDVTITIAFKSAHRTV